MVAGNGRLRGGVAGRVCRGGGGGRDRGGFGYMRVRYHTCVVVVFHVVKGSLTWLVILVNFRH